LAVGINISMLCNHPGAGAPRLRIRTTKR
jgi:hypothetical protein